MTRSSRPTGIAGANRSPPATSDKLETKQAWNLFYGMNGAQQQFAARIYQLNIRLSAGNGVTMYIFLSRPESCIFSSY